MHIRSLFLIADKSLSINETKTSKQLDVQRVVTLPENLNYFFEKTPPARGLDEYTAPLLEWLRRNALADDYVYIQGNNSLSKTISNFCMMHGIDIAEEKDIFRNEQANS